MTTIDDLRRGQTVVLRFCGSRELGNQPYTETARFNGVIGRGEDRRAVFESRDGDRTYTWNAYRFEGEWAYGSSAEPLRLVRVLDEAAA
jgi:hypothetical protein